MIPAARTFLVAALALGLLTVSAVVPRLALVAFAADILLLLAFLADGRRARALPIEATRVRPPLIVQGAVSTFAVRFAAGRACRVVAREALHPALAPHPLRQEMHIRPHTAGTWTYDLLPRRRGTHEMGPLTLRILGPWGLAWAQRDAIAPERIRVYPQVRWEGQVGRLLVLAHRHELGLISMRHRGLGGEPYALTEYRPGDPHNRIHWKASARHGRLIAREETFERGRRLVVLLDCARAMASIDAGRSKLDHALAAALALARVAASRGDRVTFLAFSDRQERMVKVEPRGLARVYETLFDLEARLTEPAFLALPEMVASVERRRSTVALLTSVADLASAEVLKESMVTLSRRHRVILVNLEDPDLVRLACGVPASVKEAFAKVSALGIVLANRRLGRRLRLGGVQVVSTAADQLAWEALDSYLNLSGRRRSAIA